MNTSQKNKINYEMSEAEQVIMDFLWNSSENRDFSEIMSYLNNKCNKNWKKQTINTFIGRLIKKGILGSKQEKNKIYFPNITRNQYEQGKAQAFLDTMYSGSLTNFISSLSGNEKVNESMKDELENLINNFDNEQRSI